MLFYLYFRGFWLSVWWHVTGEFNFRELKVANANSSRSVTSTSIHCNLYQTKRKKQYDQ